MRRFLAFFIAAAAALIALPSGAVSSTDYVTYNICVFFDDNGNGVKDAGERAAPGVVVRVSQPSAKSGPDGINVSSPGQEPTPYITDARGFAEVSATSTALFELSGAGIPSGWAVYSSHSILRRGSNGEITFPLGKVASAEISFASSVVNMNAPFLPQCVVSLKDSTGRPLEATGGKMEFTGEIDQYATAYIVVPPNMFDGTVEAVYNINGFKATGSIKYTFSSMTVIEKLNYAFSRGWLSVEGFLDYFYKGMSNPSGLPAEYRAGSFSPSSYSTPMPQPVIDYLIEHGSTAYRGGGKSGTLTQPKPAELDSFSYQANNNGANGRGPNGLIRIYNADYPGSYKYPLDAAFSDATLASMANTMQIARANVWLALGLGDPATGRLPQEEQAGYLECVIDTQKGGGGQCVHVGDFAVRIELGGNTGPYTMTHEYVHAVQFNKYRVMSWMNAKVLWWLEATADWVTCFKVIPGNTHYASKMRTQLSKVPYRAANDTAYGSPDSASYAYAGFAEYLEIKSPGIVQKSWARAGLTRDAIRALQDLLGEARFNSYYTDFMLRMIRPAEQLKGSGISAAQLAKWTGFECMQITAGADYSYKPANTVGSFAAYYQRILPGSGGDVTLSVKPPKGLELYLASKTSGGTWNYTRLTSAGTAVCTVTGLGGQIKELYLVAINTTDGNLEMPACKLSVS